MTQTKHLLHVIDSIDPVTGGPSEVIRSLFEFAPPDYTAEVVTLDDPACPFLSSYPFKVYALGNGRGPTGYNPALSRWLETNHSRFDGVMVHGLWRYISFAAWRACKGRTPYVVLPHGMLDPYFKRRYPAKHLQKWLYWLLSEYRVLRDAHCVLFTTQEESRLAKQSFWLHEWKPVVIPLGAVAPSGSMEKQAVAFVQDLPALQGQRFLLFLGRIHRKKGCDMLVSSFVRFAAKDPTLHLVMAGPDQQGWSATLKETITLAHLEDRVHWPGMLQGDVKWGAFFAAEAFILPSHQENFGIAVAEAMACGRPVLLSDKVNIAPEIAADGAGMMEADTQAGTDALIGRWIALPPESRKAMGEQALRTFQRRYDMGKNAAAILKVFDTRTGEAS